MATRKPVDYVKGRGLRQSTPLGNTVFLGLRALDPLLQRSLLLANPFANLAPKLGLSPPGAPPSGGATLASTGLTPFQSVIFFMSVGSVLKHAFWLLATCNEPMFLESAIVVAGFNTVLDSCNSIAFGAASINPTYHPWCTYSGAILYLFGISVETLGEIQRKRFKDKAENKGKLYTGGLFSLVRYPSYLGYTCWRAGYALASGGVVWSLITTSFFVWDFVTRAIPALDSYLSKRYGDQFDQFREQVPSGLIPGVV